MNPEITRVLEIIMLKNEVKELYEEIDRKIAEVKEKHGEGRFDYDLAPLDGFIEGHVLKTYEDLREKGQYLKFEIVDNIGRLEEGTFFKNVAVKPVSFSSRSLKNKPKSLKEGE